MDILRTQNQVGFSPEELLRQAHDNTKTPLKGLVDLEIEDLEELKYFQILKRTEYEDYLKRGRLDIKQWMRYANYEIQQHDMRRARSIFERALRVDNTNVPLWIQYIDAELKSKNINHARNLLERSIKLLPNIHKFWFKYLFIEESLGQFGLVREIFEKWIHWDDQNDVSFDSYIDFEVRHQEYENARAIFNRYVNVNPKISSWQKWIAFEKKLCQTDNIRAIYNFAIDFFDFNKQNTELGVILQDFAIWEAQQNEIERSTAILNICQSKSKLQPSFYDKFAKLYITNYNLMKVRIEKYEQIISNNPKDYQTWWSLIDCIEEIRTETEINNIYVNCLVSSRPNVAVLKNDEWRNYIWLWIRYLVFLENSAKFVNICQLKYEELIFDILVPLKHFTFSKVWVLYVKFLIRNTDVSIFEKKSWKETMNKSINLFPKPATFKSFIKIAIDLKDFDYARELYAQFLEQAPLSFTLWKDFIKFEDNLGDEDRCRALYKAAVHVIKNPEAKIIYKEFIEFETEQSEYSNARLLWQKLCEELYPDEPVLWVQWSTWELSSPTPEQLAKLASTDGEENGSEEDEEEFVFEIEESNKQNARDILESALKNFKADPIKRVYVLDSYKKFEETYGSVDSIASINERMPQVNHVMVKENNIDKEKIEYVFPDDVPKKAPGFSKLLDMAKKWEQGQS